MELIRDLAVEDLWYYKIDQGEYHVNSKSNRLFVS